MPSPDQLESHSTFVLPGGAIVPEFYRFGLYEGPEALGKAGKNMARVLGAVSVVMLAQ
jgi:hypothetical protein